MRAQFLKKVYRKNQVIIFSYVVMIALFILVALIKPGFGVGTHLPVLLNQAAIIAIIALGQTFVILTGGIDLSIPWTLNSAAIMLTFLSKGLDNNLALIIPLILAGTFIIGLINGIGIAYIKIPPIIMTLGLNIILQGSLLALLRGAPGGTAPPIVKQIGVGSLGPFPNLFVIWVVLSIIAIITLHYTPYGRRLYAVGNSEQVARYSGVNVAFIKLITYGISGLTAGVGGILLAGRLGQSYLGMGDPFLFQTIVAVVLGGASLMGGSGSYIGTIAGTSMLVILTGFLAAIKLPTSVQQIIYGIILVIAIVIIPDKSKKKI